MCALYLLTRSYNGEVRLKVNWINKLGGLALKTPMSPAQAKAFAAQMKGTVLAAKAAVASGASTTKAAPATNTAKRTTPAGSRAQPPRGQPQTSPEEEAAAGKTSRSDMCSRSHPPRQFN